MHNYQALFRGHREMRIVRLHQATVTDLEERKGGLMATAKLDGSQRVVTFWVTRGGSPNGARRRAHYIAGHSNLMIAGESTHFPVKIGTRVLVHNPRSNCASFPILSLEAFERELAYAKRKQGNTESIDTQQAPRKGQHRWVD